MGGGGGTRTFGQIEKLKVKILISNLQIVQGCFGSDIAEGDSFHIVKDNFMNHLPKKIGFCSQQVLFVVLVLRTYI